MIIKLLKCKYEESLSILERQRTVFTVLSLIEEFLRTDRCDSIDVTTLYMYVIGRLDTPISKAYFSSIVREHYNVWYGVICFVE